MLRVLPPAIRVLPPGNSQSDAVKPAVDAKVPNAKEEAKGKLAKTGASFAPLMGAAVVALAGGVMVARKRA